MTELMFKPDEKEIIRILNIEEEKLYHYLKLFKEWISSETHLPQSYSDTCLKKFLIWAKMDFEKAKKKFTKYCYTPITYKEFMRDRIMTVDGDLRSPNFVYQVPMRRLTPEGCRIYIFKIIDPENFDVFQTIRNILLKVDYKIHLDGMVAGEIGVYDMIDMKPQHYTKLFSPAFLRFVKFGLTILPLILKNVFIINCHPLLEKGFGAVQAVLPKKLADRFLALSNPEDLKKYIPPECLPEELGGTDLPLPALEKLWLEHFMEQKDFYVGLPEIKPTGPVPEEFQSVPNEFGVAGSFRKLNID